MKYICCYWKNKIYNAINTYTSDAFLIEEDDFQLLKKLVATKVQELCFDAHNYDYKIMPLDNLKIFTTKKQIVEKTRIFEEATGALGFCLMEIEKK